MTEQFEGDIHTLTHLVTYPSVWVPPPNTLRVLVLNSQDNHVQELANSSQVIQSKKNWAFYYVPAMNWQNEEHVDWILTYLPHMEAIVTVCTSPVDLGLGASLGEISLFWLPEPNALVEKVAHFTDEHLHVTTDSVIQDIDERHTL
jgi:hypothetical protein